MTKSYIVSQSLLSTSYITISLVGLVILAISIFTLPKSTSNFNQQKQLIGSIFSIICLLGIIAGVFPHKCSQVPHFRKLKKSNRKEQSDKNTTFVEFIGHHPACGKFTTHMLLLGRRKYCAGCTGLIVGAVISLLGILSYMLFDFHVGGIVEIVFWVGFTVVVFGLLQYHIPYGSIGLIHFSFNLAFVLGSFFILLAVNEITGNFVLEVYLLALMVFWIVTRIVVSQQEHSKICAACPGTCSVF